MADYKEGEMRLSYERVRSRHPNLFIFPIPVYNTSPETWAIFDAEQREVLAWCREHIKHKDDWRFQASGVQFLSVSIGDIEEAISFRLRWC